MTKTTPKYRRNVVKNAIPLVGILCLILCVVVPAQSEELQFQIDSHWKEATSAGTMLFA